VWILSIGVLIDLLFFELPFADLWVRHVDNDETALFLVVEEDAQSNLAAITRDLFRARGEGEPTV